MTSNLQTQHTDKMTDIFIPLWVGVSPRIMFFISIDALAVLTLKVLVMTIDALGHFKQDNYCTVGGDRGHRVSEVRASTTSPMPDHKGFKLQ